MSETRSPIFFKPGQPHFQDPGFYQPGLRLVDCNAATALGAIRLTLGGEGTLPFLDEGDAVVTKFSRRFEPAMHALFASILAGISERFGRYHEGSFTLPGVMGWRCPPKALGGDTKFTHENGSRLRFKTSPSRVELTVVNRQGLYGETDYINAMRSIVLQRGQRPRFELELELGFKLLQDAHIEAINLASLWLFQGPSPVKEGDNLSVKDERGEEFAKGVVEGGRLVYSPPVDLKHIAGLSRKGLEISSERLLNLGLGISLKTSNPSPIQGPLAFALRKIGVPSHVIE